MFFYIFVFLLVVALVLWWVLGRMKMNAQYLRASSFKIFLVKVPYEIKLKEGESPKSFVEFVGVAEQLFSGLHSIHSLDTKKRFLTGQDHLSLEITFFEGEIGFYFAAPKKISEMVEKQVHSFYPYAEISEVLEHQTFHKRPGFLAAASLKMTKKNIFPITTYKHLEADPLNAVLGVISKLDKSESAAVQILIKPEGDEWRVKSQKEIKRIQMNKPAGSGNKLMDTTGGLAREFSNVAAGRKISGEKAGAPGQASMPPTPPQITPMQDETIRLIEEKASKTAFKCQVRIICASPSKDRVEANLRSISSAFAQYNSSEGNSLTVKEHEDFDKEIKYYIFRIFDPKGKELLLNTEELASLYHFPNQFIDAPNILYLTAKDAPPPSNLPTKGTLIGSAHYRGVEKPIYIKDDDRRRHVYAIGKTGVGKTTLIEEMVMADIKSGKGVCLIDPHGDCADSVLGKIPKERAEDLVLFDPGRTERPLGFNLLEARTKEERDFLVQEAVSIFYKLFDPTGQGFIGPQFEHWMRNAALTLMEQPDGGTLIEIPRLFTDKDFERKNVMNLKDPIVKSFWTKQMAQTAEFHKSEMLNYFTSKFGRFMTNEMIRNIIGQPHSSFDIREIMDSGKILICNLSKGKMGEVNSNLIGMILVSKIQMAAMSRASTPEEERRDFYLYVDEFQNFATDSFGSILSEARKYHLNLMIANQYIAQLDEKIRDAVFGNVGTLISFRIGAQEAEFMAKEFEPVFGGNDLINVDKHHAYIRLLIDGVPARPFSMKTVLDKSPLSPEVAEAVSKLSLLKYGKDRAVVDGEIKERSRYDLSAFAGGGGVGGGEGGEKMAGNPGA